MTIKNNDIYSDVEYIYISYKGMPIVTLEGSSVNGKTKTQLQYELGKEFGEKNFNYSMKIKGKLKNDSGGIRGIRIGSADNKPKEIDSNFNDLKKELMELKNNNNFDRIEKLIDEKYQIQIKHLEEKIKDLQKENNDYEKNYNDLIKQVEKSENSENSMLTNLLKMIPIDKLLGKPTPGLANNQVPGPSGQVNIRPEILNVLNKVDYSKLTDEQVKQYAELLIQFTNNLPKKEGN